MKKSMILFNLDSGDAIALGELFESGPVAGLGLHDPHMLFAGLPSMGTIGLPHEEFNLKRDARGHRLNFFLASSCGCRLIVIPLEDFDRLMHEAATELGKPLALMWGLGVTKEGSTDEYMSRRAKREHRELPSASADPKRHSDRVAEIQGEIKDTIKRGFVTLPDGKIEYRFGDKHPRPIFKRYFDQDKEV